MPSCQSDFKKLYSSSGVFLYNIMLSKMYIGKNILIQVCRPIDRTCKTVIK